MSYMRLLAEKKKRGKTMKKLVVSLIIVLTLFLSTFAVLTPKASASGTSNADAIAQHGVVNVSVPSVTLYDEAVFENTMSGLSFFCGAIPADSWSDNMYWIKGPAKIIITITDVGFVGDYYELWMTTSPSWHVLTNPFDTVVSFWKLVGTTPAVYTDGYLVAPSYNPLWDGTGKVYSSGAFCVWIPCGVTAYFRVRDALFDSMGNALDSVLHETTAQLVSLGGSATGVYVHSYWNPAGFDISFTPAP